jgi:quercetin dioxygenase-like cupin family protein
VIRQHIPSIFAALLVGLVPLGPALAQSATPVPLAGPPGPVTRFPTRFLIVDAPERFDQVLTIVDFQPGSWTPRHTSGGNVYNTVVEGVISTRGVGSTSFDAAYEAGGTFVEPAGEYLEIGNSGDTGARMISTTVLPKGAPLTIYDMVNIEPYRSLAEGYLSPELVGHPARPTSIQQALVDIERPARVFELLHMLVEFEPGMWTATHTHGGQDFSIVASGAVTLLRSGESEPLVLGESFVNTPGLMHTVGNESGDFAQVAATFLLSSGAILTTVQPVDSSASLDEAAAVEAQSLATQSMAEQCEARYGSLNSGYTTGDSQSPCMRAVNTTAAVRP